MCLDQLIYIVVNDGDALSSEFFIYILVSTVLANKKKDYLALVYGVMAPCYQHNKQSATTPPDKIPSF